jgi:zeta-carotene desaturase
MAAAVALESAGFHTTLLESRGFLGGRATDNCQHILLGCCANLLDFYQRLGVADQLHFDHEFHFIEPGGRVSELRQGLLSFARLPFLSPRAKFAIVRALATVRRDWKRRQDLDRITMLDWLRERDQPPDALNHFWGPVLVSALNVELDVMAARHGLQVFRLGSLPMALALAPPENLGPVSIRLRAPVERIRREGVEVRGELLQADWYVCALPHERVGEVAPELGLDLSAFRHSPITGIHLWFDRPITDLPHAALLDRTIQWLFNKEDGRHVQLVVSASHSLVEMPRSEVIQLALTELADFLPKVRTATLEKAHVVKELRATFAPVPGLEAKRPHAATAFQNLFLAGDWTRQGWPSTMEGAVRSGYLAAEALTQAAGHPQKFLLPGE